MPTSGARGDDKIHEWWIRLHFALEVSLLLYNTCWLACPFYTFSVWELGSHWVIPCLLLPILHSCYYSTTSFFWIQFHQLDINFEIPSSFNFLIQFHLTTRRNYQKSIKSDLICSTLISPTQYFSRFIFTILISFNSMISSFAFVTLLGTLINRPIPKYT